VTGLVFVVKVYIMALYILTPSWLVQNCVENRFLFVHLLSLINDEFVFFWNIHRCSQCLFHTKFQANLLLDHKNVYQYVLRISTVCMTYRKQTKLVIWQWLVLVAGYSWLRLVWRRVINCIGYVESLLSAAYSILPICCAKGIWREKYLNSLWKFVSMSWRVYRGHVCLFCLILLSYSHIVRRLNVYIDLWKCFCFNNIATSFIQSLVALQPFVGPWPLLQFRNFFYTVGRTPWTSDYLVARPLPTHRHPCLEWASNPRSQCSSERRQFFP
jgi:hypothetical protein